MKLRVLSDAEAEIESARKWLNRESSKLAMQFLDDLAVTFAEIGDRPSSYSKVETLPDGSPYRRAILKRFRYAVIFELLENEILVVAVAHTSREPNYWLDRTN